ncbi:MAG: nucleotidyltransferase family protein [Thermoguttaceae bacterium]|jgi:mannose-1-phosphate guanylyltransferase/phosphomannomutase
MKAMVLCAGYGTRLGELTQQIPKPMLPLADRPMLQYILCHLVRHGFDRIAVNLHFKPEAIRDHFGDGSRWGAELTYALEPELLGTAGGVKNMAAFFAGEEAFLVQYGDILTDQDFSAMLRFHREQHALVTILVHRRAGSNSAIAVDDRGQVVRFLERPTEEERRLVSSAWVFSGVTICHPAVLDLIPAGSFCDLPRDIFTRLAGTGQLYAFPLTGWRCAVDSPERLAEARAAVAEGRYGACPRS